MKWDIHIPIRPKCVQSVRFGGHAYVKSDVRKWKAAITPYIRASYKGKPSPYPIRLVLFDYLFRIPMSTPANMKRYVEAGGIVPYLAPADITDNLNKGLVDCCKAILFEDDRLIWEVCHIRKIYGVKDSIHIVFEDCPDILLITGERADGTKDEVQSLPSFAL